MLIRLNKHKLNQKKSKTVEKGTPVNVEQKFFFSTGNWVLNFLSFFKSHIFLGNRMCNRCGQIMRFRRFRKRVIDLKWFESLICHLFALNNPKRITWRRGDRAWKEEEPERERKRKVIKFKVQYELRILPLFNLFYSLETEFRFDLPFFSFEKPDCNWFFAILGQLPVCFSSETKS